jgi:hypothetical protein
MIVIDVPNRVNSAKTERRVVGACACRPGKPVSRAGTQVQAAIAVTVARKGGEKPKTGLEGRTFGRWRSAISGLSPIPASAYAQVSVMVTANAYRLRDWRRRDAGARPVMYAFTPRAMPDDLARLYVLEATIETLKAENEILKRRLAATETWAAQAVITERLDQLAAERRRSLLRWWFGWRAAYTKGPAG